MDLSQDGQRRTVNEMMAGIFSKMIQKGVEGGGKKNVKTLGVKSRKKETKKRAKPKSPALVIRDR